jgi:hypothetical protein
MKTMDTLENLPFGAMSSPAARRNIDPIRAVLASHFPTRGRVLEIAAGAGEHAVAFAGAFPGLEWTASDPSAEARASITAWAGFNGAPNLREPIHLDAADPETWPDGPFDAVLCINMIHISPWSATAGLMAGAGAVLANPGGLLVVYGPFREADVMLAPSNAAFDDSLKSRDPRWGLRDLAAVVAEARRTGLHLTRRIEMPANNLMLLFRRA